MQTLFCTSGDLVEKKHLRMLSIRQMQKYFVLNIFEDCIRVLMVVVVVVVVVVFLAS